MNRIYPKHGLTLRGSSPVKTFRDVDRTKFLQELLLRLSPYQATKVEQVYMGMREYMDQNLFYRRRNFWRIGKALRLRYVVRELIAMVEGSEAFVCQYNERGELVAFASPYVLNTDRQLRMRL